MSKYFKFLFVMAIFTGLFSSCKKTDFSILTSHKWVLNSWTETYSDSTGVSHNLMPPDTTCQSSSYTEFHNNATNAVLKLAYTYSTTNCAGAYIMPDLGITSWNIDPDNTVLYLNGNTSDGTNGTWYTIQSLGSSSMVLTIVHQHQVSNVGGNNPIFDNVTDTWTYGVK